MLKKVLIVCLLFATAINCYGQVGNIMATYNVGGMRSIKLPKEYKFDYNSLKTVSFGYEFCQWSNSEYIELSYTQANLKDYLKEDDGELRLAPTKFDKQVEEYSVHVLYGKLLNRGKRIAFPLYAGIGGYYVQGSPFKHFFLSAEAKIRIKFYLLNWLGLFVGINGKAGIGSYSTPSEKDEDINDIHFMSSYGANPEVGIIFSIN